MATHDGDAQSSGQASGSSTMTPSSKQVSDTWTARIHRRHHAIPPPHHVVQSAGKAAARMIDMIPFVPSMLPAGTKAAYPQPSEFQAADGTSLVAEDEWSETSDEQQSVNAATDGSGDEKHKKKRKRKRYVRSGFRNPWDSWHSPTMTELWSGLSWKSNDEYKGHVSFKEFQLAIDDAHFRESSGQVTRTVEETCEKERGEAFIRLSSRSSTHDSTTAHGVLLNGDDLLLRKPEFRHTMESDQVQATWLGHASVLVQMPTLSSNPMESVRILFDPIFSVRCSPTQALGPARLYLAPCTIADLPPIDIVAISHSHYDHLDYDSIVQLWERNIDRLRFVVPLGNKSWFLELGLKIPHDRVVELDWWDDVTFSTNKDILTAVKNVPRLKMTCTPAQHGSGRYGFDNSKTLWSSWTVEYISEKGTFRVFFGGDTGYQFHSSTASATPGTAQPSREASPHPKSGASTPAQSMPGGFVESTEADRERMYPTCPAFAEVRALIGPIDLAFLPISVGASFNYVKSYDSLGLVPTLDSGLTGSNHMTPDDAVRVSQILTASATMHRIGDDRPSDASPTNRAGTTIAMHWGTFVSGIDEVRRSMRDVKASCEKRSVDYVRDPGPRVLPPADVVTNERGRFACLDHGQSMLFTMSGK